MEKDKKKIFIDKSNKIYDNKYDYSLVDYKTSFIKVKIICPLHGEFMKEPTYHTTKKQGCPKCGNLKSAIGKKMSNEEYINKVSKIHNNFYDYKLVDFENIHDKIKIICPDHGIFEQKASNHLHSKQNCPFCINNNFKSDTETFINKSKEIYGDKYDYSLVEYVNNKTNIKLKYGDEIYEQSPKSHLKGMSINMTSIISMSIEEKILKDFNKIHNNKYKYNDFIYKKNTQKIVIICVEHGIFNPSINSHLFGSGCPKCNTSKGEIEIQKLLKSKNIKFEGQKKFEDCKNKNSLSFDFYLPDYNICIEFDGLQHFVAIEFWGGDKKLQQQQINDKIKTDFCINNNIKLIRIRYDENVEEKLKIIL